MSSKEEELSAKEARAALSVVEEINSSTHDRFRSSARDNAIISLCFAVFSCAIAFDGIAGWNYVAIFLTVFFVPLLILGFSLMLKAGIRVNLLPHSLSGKALSVGMVVLFVAVMFGAEYLYLEGLSWAPYAAGVINGAVYSICMWKAPLGEWLPKERVS